MKRLHVHLSVSDLQASVRFYSALFATEPSVLKDDYAKWLLDEPRVNFAISNRSAKHGLDHLGIQVESGVTLDEVAQRLQQAELPLKTEENTACCYARSDKHWTLDPDGVAWETFHSLQAIPTYNEDKGDACCAPKGVQRMAKACC